MTTLQSILKARLDDEVTCDASAWIQGEAKSTYAQIFRQAAYLRNQLGEARGNPALVCGHKESAMLAAFLACMASGRPFVPVDQSLPAARIGQMAEITGAQHVIVCNKAAGRDISLAAPGITTIDASERNEANADALFDHMVAGLETAYIIFTSGTTGEPKGVQIPMEALDDFLNWTVNSLFPTPPEKKVWMNHAVLSFDLSVFELWTSMATAGTIVALNSSSNRNIRAVFRDLSDNGVQIWVSTPSFADLCLLERRFSSETIPSLEDFVFCGEILSAHTAQLLKQRFPTARVWNLYGPTEATCATTGLEITAKILKSGGALPVGYAKPGTQIAIDNGEIVVSGTNVSTGYVNRPELSAAKFSQRDGLRSYRTGDLGELDTAGLLFCMGRMDSQIKLHGYRIELGEIETAMRGLQGIEAAACTAITESDKVTAIGCCYCGNKLDNDSLHESLASSLPAYMIPSRFLHVDAVPLTRNGKIDRQQIRELFN